jgi:glycerophosphoryl diester phosphodiesterase
MSSTINFKIPKIIGHRGACGYAPENTLVSMLKAFELEIDWVEFDVMLTQDNEAIIIHDTTLDRTTSGKGKIAEMTLEKIKKLDAGSWFAKEFSGEKIPTFKELLEFLTKLKMRLVVEIKPTSGKEIATAEKTVELLQQYWPFKNTLLVSSAQPNSLHAVYRLNPKLPLGFISDHWLKDWQKILSDMHCVSLHINHKVLSQSRVNEFKKSHYYLLAYTVNDPERARELFAWGVDGIFSDYPDRIEKKEFN